MSGKMVQLDMFVSQSTQQKAIDDEEFKKSTRKSIKGLFARYNEMEYILLEMNKTLDKLCDNVYGKKSLELTP